MSGYNVVVHLSVSRPEAEYLPALLRQRLAAYDAYAGFIRVEAVEVVADECPFTEPENLEAALREL